MLHGSAPSAAAVAALLIAVAALAPAANPVPSAGGPAAVTHAARPPADALLNGRDLINAGRWLDAERFYRHAVNADATSAEARFGLATVLTQLERFGEALPLLEALSREFPDNPAVLNNLAWVLVKADDPALRDAHRGMLLARDAVLDAPTDFNIWNTLAEAYLANRQPDRALRAARIALALGRAQPGVTSLAPLMNLVQRCARATGEPLEAAPTP